MKATNNKAQSAKKTVTKTEAKKVSTYELNVLKTNQNYKDYKGSLGFIRSALLEMHTNFKKLDVKFVDYLNSTKKDQKKYEELKKATRFNDNGQTCVFYVLQALNKLTK